MNDSDRIRLLIIDDHRIFREALRTRLAKEFDIIGEAASAESGIQLAIELKPQVIILDLGMTGMGGLNGAHRIAREAPSCRVLVLSQYDDEAYVIEVLTEAGAAGYLLKSDAPAELVSALKAVHAGRRYLSPSIAPIILGRLKNPPAGKSPLTRREREILKLIAEGATSKEIAQRLGISPRTAQAHREKLKEKLDLRSTAAMVRYAIKHKMIRID
ncbi:MAG TPA: response regulator transcription factor [Candidatus Binataceae bacterium]